METKLAIKNELIRQFNLRQAILDSEGEISEDLELALKSNDLSLKETIDNVADTLDFLEEDLERLAKLRKRLSERSKYLETIAERLKDSIRSGMELGGSNKIAGNYRGFTLGSHNISVDWDATREIPAPFQRIKIEFDKQKMKDVLSWEKDSIIDQLKRAGLIMSTKRTLRKTGLAVLKELES